MMKLLYYWLPALLLLIACESEKHNEPPAETDPEPELQLSYKFYFGENDKEGWEKIMPGDKYGGSSSYGYDLNTTGEGNEPYFFSIDLPEGNYTVTVVMGNSAKATQTTIWSESRRLMLESVETAAGEFITRDFAVNTRNTRITGTEHVAIKQPEEGKLNWDNKLTLEINGESPGLLEMVVKEADIPSLFLAGNSTVTDQDIEPWWHGWGQVLPRFLSSSIAVANYAESGETATSFLDSGRFDKIVSRMEEGDYLFIEFGHNDQKETGMNVGPYANYKRNLKYMVDEAKKKGVTPILVTPIHRRNFNSSNKIVNSLGEYPNAMRELANEENVELIDLNELSRILFEAWGPELSKSAFGHYPAGTFPGQTQDYDDNTHFNLFGAYELAKCVLMDLVLYNPPLKRFIVKEYIYFNPSNPDHPADFYIKPSMLDKYIDY